MYINSRNKHGVLWTGSILLLLLAAGIGVFAYLWESPTGVKKTQSVSLPSECLENENRSKRIVCVIEALKKPIARHGASPYLAALEREFVQNDSANSGGITACHDIAHGIASAAVEALGDVRRVLGECTNICTFGCYHGAVERYVAAGGKIAETIQTLCMDVGQEGRPACLHGLGHGVAEVAGYDLKKAFALCDKLSLDAERRDCGFGVFMEVFEPSTFGRASLPIPEDLPRFCSGLYGVYAEACVRLSGGYEHARSRDAGSAFRVCQTLDPDGRWSCAVGFGQNIYFSFQGKPEEVLSLCAAGSKDQPRECAHGALMSSVVSDPTARHGFEFCAVLEGDRKNDCHGFLGAHIRAVHGEEARRDLCGALKESDRLVCAGSL
jgi:hypothetical protein